MGTTSGFHIERFCRTKRRLSDVVEKKDHSVTGSRVGARWRLCLVLLLMAELGLFMFYF